MKRHWIVLVVVCGFVHVPAFAQGTYVGAALTGDIVRFSAAEEARLPEFSGGEAIGFALRLGTRLGPAWGVEAEFARAAEIRREGSPQVIPLRALDAPTIITGSNPLTIPRVDPVIFPPINYRVRTAYRDVTFSAAIWARQDFSGRFALVYSGGVGFHRTEREVEFMFDPVPFPRLAGTSLSFVNSAVVAVPSGIYGSDTVTYTARPFAGIDARVRMTERLDLVPAIRLHGLSGGLLLRPSVGLNWLF